jgi:DNA polymerase-3 subunit epsilon
MIRQTILDTETTGLEPSEGQRIIEISCVELINRWTTVASASLRVRQLIKL